MTAEIIVLGRLEKSAAVIDIARELARLSNLAKSAGMDELSDAIRKGEAVAREQAQAATASLSLVSEVERLERENPLEPDARVVAFLMERPVSSHGYDDIAATRRAFPDLSAKTILASCVAAIREVGALRSFVER